MSNILQKIVADLRLEVEKKKQNTPLDEYNFPLRPSFRAAFPGIIAELKKASPSQGVIRENFDVISLALELEQAGAAALSVLTEPNYFRGSINYLQTVSKTVVIPLLRKDFIFDRYQILEARHAGASAVLLIAAMLPQKELIALGEYAISIGLDVLGEAHNEEEVKRLLDSPATLIGVNARDLGTFATDLKQVEKLLKLIPPERYPIAESAIKNREDIRILKNAGAKGFLIGETLMRSSSPGAKLKELMQ